MEREDFSAGGILQLNPKIEISACIAGQLRFEMQVRRFICRRFQSLFLPHIRHMVIGQQNPGVIGLGNSGAVADGECHINMFRKRIAVPAECQRRILLCKGYPDVISVEISGRRRKEQRAHPAPADADAPGRTGEFSPEQRDRELRFDRPFAVFLRLPELNIGFLPGHFLRVAAGNCLQTAVSRGIDKQVMIDAYVRIRCGVNEEFRNVLKTCLDSILLFSGDKASIPRQFRFHCQIDGCAVRGDEAFCGTPFQFSAGSVPHSVKRE